jgi:xylulokinase
LSTSGDTSVVVTLDIGGSAVKASAFCTRRRRSVASITQAWQERSFSADRTECDLDSWWATTTEALKGLVGGSGLDPSQFAAVTVSAIRIPFVLLDRQLDAVRPCILNRDRRATIQTERIRRAFTDSELHDLTGHWAAPEFGLAKVLWVAGNEPGAWNRAERILQLHDWFIFRLSGEICSESSSAAMSQMLAVDGSGWASAVLDEFHLDAGRFPPLRPSGIRIGGLAGSVASAVGLPQGLPVHLGGGDTHMSALSASGLSNTAATIVAGSTAPVQVARRSLPDPKTQWPLLISPHLYRGTWAFESNIAAAGSIIAKLANLAESGGPELEMELRRRGFEIGSSDAAGSLVVLAGHPFFGPQGWAASPPPTVYGLRPFHRGADVLRSALQGTCYALRSVLGTLGSTPGAEFEEVVVTGGMSGNHQWVQLLADTCGIPVSTRDADVTAGLAGAALALDPEVLKVLADIEALVFEPHDDRPDGGGSGGGGSGGEGSYGKHDEGFQEYLRLFKLAQERVREREPAVNASSR